jgi:hypothetical protein
MANKLRNPKTLIAGTISAAALFAGCASGPSGETSSSQTSTAPAVAANAGGSFVV